MIPTSANAVRIQRRILHAVPRYHDTNRAATANDTTPERLAVSYSTGRRVSRPVSLRRTLRGIMIPTSANVVRIQRRILHAVPWYHDTTKGGLCLAYYVENFDVGDYDMTDTEQAARQLYNSAKNRSCNGVLDFVNGIQDTPETPIKTGLQALDDIMNGGLYSGLYMLGGETGAGKTTLLIQTARKIVEQNDSVDVVYFGFETSEKEFFGKMLSGYLLDCCGVGLSYNDLQQAQGDTLAEIKEYANKMNDKIKGRILMYPERRQGYTTAEISEIARIHHETGRRFVLVVDYLQRLQENSDKAAPTRREQIDNDIYTLSSVAKTYNIPCVVVSSLNRSSYTRNSGRLQNTGFKESGGIEYTCDLSLFLEEQRTKIGKAVITRRDETRPWNGVPNTVTAFNRITINKNRHGATGAALLKYAKAYNTFDNDETGTAEYNPYFDDYITTVKTTEKKREDRQCDNWNTTQ